MIISPCTIEYWETNPKAITQNSHVAKCARVCYANENNNNSNAILINRLIDNKHFSMFRHETNYYVIAVKSLTAKIISDYEKYIGIYIIKGINYIFIVTNGQFNLEHEDFTRFANEYRTTKAQYIHMCYIDKTIEALYNLRYTFYLNTQISTTRELNRVSPNNIAEQSTRYCNYSKNKFNNNVTIAEPHWINNNKYSKFIKFIFKLSYWLSTKLYIILTKYNVAAQDARGVLPLDTMSKVVYTYTINEWKHIFDLRYFGTTGVPHPNAKYITKLIFDKLDEEFEKDINSHKPDCK